VVLALVATNAALAEPSGPDAISVFTISPCPVYPGNEITFYIEWTGATGLSLGDGHALCLYYDVNLNNSIGLIADGFTAIGDVVSFGGDTYVKEGPSNFGDPTANCPSSTGDYVVGFVVTEASGGIQNREVFWKSPSSCPAKLPPNLSFCVNVAIQQVPVGGQVSHLELPL